MSRFFALFLVASLTLLTGCPWIDDTGDLDTDDPDVDTSSGTEVDPDCADATFGETTFDESCFGA